MRQLMMSFQSALKYNRDARIIVAALAFYGAACLGHFLRFEGSVHLPAWPPSGVAFALVLLMGRDTWPGIAIGSLLASFLSPWMATELPVQGVITVAGMMALSHTLEAVLGATLLKKWVGDKFAFDSSRGAFRFLFVAVAMCSCGAALSMTAFWGNGIIAPDELLKTGVLWTVGNLVGVLLFTPFLLCVARRQRVAFSLEKGSQP